jgi:hypothetical protein
VKTTSVLKRPKTGLNFNTSIAKVWLERYARKSGDFMPDKGEIHLPEYTWKMVFALFVREHGGGICHYSTFMRMRVNELSYIKIRKCKAFAACHHCVRLKELVKGKTGKTKAFWEGELAAHNAWQMRERMKCAKHVEKATNKTTKHKAMVMMVDNMDHSKADLPHFPSAPKDMEHSAHLVTHMTGVHVPGWTRRPTMCYTWHDQFPTSSDAVITIILMVLCECAKDGPLPETLYLHLDNCWRENKNKYVLGIAHMLVQRKVFKRVKIAFLPVGHTHNIVDQMFSCFANKLRTSTFATVEELHNLCRMSYKQSVCGCGSRWKIKKDSLVEVKTNCGCVKQYVYMEHLVEMACWGPVLREYLAKNIHGISKPRYFCIKRDEKGVVRHHYRAQLQKLKSAADLEENIHVGCSPDGNRMAAFDSDKQAATLAWMPLNSPGYEVFPNCFPPIDKIVNVPKKALDWMGLRKCLGLMSGLLKVLDVRLGGDRFVWWTTTLETMENEEKRYI